MFDVITPYLFYSCVCYICITKASRVLFNLPMPITALTFDQLFVECLFSGGGGDMKSIPFLSEEEKKKLIPKMWLTFES